MASARFFGRLRLLTLIHDVPLIFDEVQTGFGATGKMWAHEHFDLPAPPDVVTWAKKAQNGVLFVSEALAVFFQEEKKFNTTWEGDSAGMARLLPLLDKLDLEQVRSTGERARKGLDALARDYGAGLKIYRAWLYEHIPARKLADKHRDYFSPEEIDAILAATARRRV